MFSHQIRDGKEKENSLPSVRQDLIGPDEPNFNRFDERGKDNEHPALRYENKKAFFYFYWQTSLSSGGVLDTNVVVTVHLQMEEGDERDEQKPRWGFPPQTRRLAGCVQQYHLKSYDTVHTYSSENGAAVCTNAEGEAGRRRLGPIARRADSVYRGLESMSGRP
ncbi:hypothetical protein F2P81_008452 [Scophthalmus maximus]|uniref:Uncharacterized protein n=1 Tax=Scophthalmus maximus TaxID=52904 RepID=A0A6A4T2B7_SCOMX|nr:hypothetical protein F2P81_008452 [Scophthalmus maximus]